MTKEQKLQAELEDERAVRKQLENFASELSRDLGECSKELNFRRKQVLAFTKQ